MATVHAGEAAGKRGRDALVIGLITLGHFFAHFYIIALPPLFPVLADALDVGYAELGVAVAVLNLLTAITQAPIGVLVDRYGPARILIAGQVAFALSMVGIGLFPDYAVLLLMCALAGLGNAVFHPADYAILAARVSGARMGRAFSFHTFGGYAGFAAAPPVLVALDALWGWRAALVAVGLVGLAVAALMVLARRHLHVEPHPEARRREGGSRADIALFLSRPVLLAFLFIASYATAHVGLNNFTVAFLERLYGFDLATANLPLTVFLVLSAVGVLVGGWVADSFRRHELVVAGCLLATAVVAVLVAEFTFDLPVLVALFGLAGFSTGVVAPSRDMLVRNVAPPGTVGRVFGFVTTGFNVAGLAGPPVFGLVLDLGHPALVMWLAALFCVITLPTVLSASAAGRPAALRAR